MKLRHFCHTECNLQIPQDCFICFKVAEMTCTVMVAILPVHGAITNNHVASESLSLRKYFLFAQ